MKVWGFGVLLLLAAVAPASARMEVKPQPSGIVVHLFGQGSLMSGMMPDTQATPTTAAAPGARTLSGPTTGAAPYREPTAHDILHQLFITGDPNAKPGFATGRTLHKMDN